MSEWRENAGTCPASAMGKRVVVELRNGSICGDKPVSPTSPPGWAADGKGACRWSFSTGPSSQFDIIRYRIL